MTDGKRLLEFVKDIRKLCRQSAALLKMTDEHMATTNWENAMKLNIAYADSSSSLLVPDKWFPYEMTRLYKNSARPKHVLFVSLLLDDANDRGYTLDEPLATAGWVELAAPLSAVQYWWSRLHGYRAKRRNDGVVTLLAPDDLSWTETSFDRAWTLGLPLVELRSADDLRERLLVPLTTQFEATVAVDPPAETD